jgi:type VI protein secretion system component Hcp
MKKKKRRNVKITLEIPLPFHIIHSQNFQLQVKYLEVKMYNVVLIHMSNSHNQTNNISYSAIKN